MDNSEIEIGKEYLFSDDKDEWELEELTEFEEDDKAYPYKTNCGWFAYIKPLEEIPERTLYTQSMKNKGRPIEVGMWFLDDKGIERKCLLGEDDSRWVVYSASLENIRYDITADVTPFPDPVELIDGEAYEFEHENTTYKGIYYKYHDTLHTATSVTNSSLCTNIKHLTVSN